MSWCVVDAPPKVHELPKRSTSVQRRILVSMLSTAVLLRTRKILHIDASGFRCLAQRYANDRLAHFFMQHVSDSSMELRTFWILHFTKPCNSQGSLARKLSMEHRCACSVCSDVYLVSPLQRIHSHIDEFGHPIPSSHRHRRSREKP